MYNKRNYAVERIQNQLIERDEDWFPLLSRDSGVANGH